MASQNTRNNAFDIKVAVLNECRLLFQTFWYLLGPVALYLTCSKVKCIWGKSCVRVSIWTKVHILLQGTINRPKINYQSCKVCQQGRKSTHTIIARRHDDGSLSARGMQQCGWMDGWMGYRNRRINPEKWSRSGNSTESNSFRLRRGEFRNTCTRSLHGLLKTS